MKNTTEIKELNQKDEKALYKELTDLNKKMADLKLKSSFRKLKNVHEITDTRKKVARIWTILNARLIEKIEKEIAQ